MQFDELQKEFEQIRSLLNSAALKAGARDFDGASREYETCLDLLEKGHPEDHPDRIACLEGLAHCYFVLHRYVEARQIFKILLKVSEGPPEKKMDALVLRFKLAKCAERAGSVQEAVSFYQKVMDTAQPTLPEGSPLYSSVLESYSTLLSRSGIDSKKAKTLAQKARSNRSKYSAKAPVSDQVLRGIGKDWEDYQDGQNSQDFRTGEPTTDNLQSFTTTGGGILRSIEAMPSQRPSYALTARQMMITLVCLGLCAATAYGFHFFKHVENKKLPPSHFLAQCKSMAQAGNWLETIHAADQLLEVDRDNLQARWYRAVALGKMGDYERALQDFNLLADKQPQNAKIMVGRAGIYMFLGKTQEAIDDCNRAIKIDPNEPKAYDFRGAADLRQCKFSEAQADLNQATKLNCKDVNPFDNPGLNVSLSVHL